MGGAHTEQNREEFEGVGCAGPCSKKKNRKKRQDGRTSLSRGQNFKICTNTYVLICYKKCQAFIRRMVERDGVCAHTTAVPFFFRSFLPLFTLRDGGRQDVTGVDEECHLLGGIGVERPSSYTQEQHLLRSGNRFVLGSVTNSPGSGKTKGGDGPLGGVSGVDGICQRSQPEGEGNLGRQRLCQVVTESGCGHLEGSQITVEEAKSGGGEEYGGDKGSNAVSLGFAIDHAEEGVEELVDSEGGVEELGGDCEFALCQFGGCEPGNSNIAGEVFLFTGDGGEGSAARERGGYWQSIYLSRLWGETQTTN